MTYCFSSILLASILHLISACGGGSGGESTSLSDVQPVVKHFSPTANPVRLDTIISGNLYYLSPKSRFTLAKDCSGLVCKTAAGQTLDFTYEANSQIGMLNADGRVNGPATRNVQLSNGTGNMIGHFYWMGSSIFYTTNISDSNRAGKYYKQGTYAMGEGTGSRLLKNATHTGKVIAISTGGDFEDYEQEDVEHGDFSLTYDLNDASVEIDLKFEDWDHTFNAVNVSSDGSFSGNSNGKIVRGAFFGSGHKEVAGTYEIPGKSVVGAFGGIKD